MTRLDALLATLAAFAGRNAGPLVTGAAAVVVALLVVAVWRAARTGRVDRLITALAWIAGFGFSLEGTWVVTTQRAHVLPLVAVGVFFFGEALQAKSMIQGARYYRLHRHPGKHGRAVWLIAVVIGVVVMFAASNVAEALLRLAIPLGIALAWWNDLTAEGTVRQRGRWRWTPTRLAEWAGAIEPDDGERDMTAAARERHVAAMVRAADRLLNGGTLPGDRGRLRRLARGADGAMVAEVADRVDRAQRILYLIRPDTRADIVQGEAPDNEQDIHPDSGPDTEADKAPDTQGLDDRAPDRTDEAEKPDSIDRAPVLNPTAIAILRLRTRQPKITQAQAAKRLGKDPRTVRRYWPETTPPTPSAAEPAQPANGKTPSLTG